MAGVPSDGPSSNVSAKARPPAGPRHTLGANTLDERPRTAHAANPQAAAAASGPRTLLEPLLIEEIQSEQTVLFTQRDCRPLLGERPLHPHHLRIAGGHV